MINYKQLWGLHFDIFLLHMHSELSSTIYQKYYFSSLFFISSFTFHPHLPPLHLPPPSFTSPTSSPSYYYYYVLGDSCLMVRFGSGC